jgi:hypothetical protein
MSEFMQDTYLIILLVTVPILVVLTFAIPLLLWWWWQGKDPKEGLSYPIYQVPQELAPIEVGLLLNDRVDGYDVSAQLIYLAQKGYLDFEHMGKTDDYRLRATGETMPSKEYNQLLLKTVFGERNEVLLSEVFARVGVQDAKAYKQVEKLVSELVTQEKYYDRDPFRVRKNFHQLMFAWFVAPMLFVIYMMLLQIFYSGFDPKYFEFNFMAGAFVLIFPLVVLSLFTIFVKNRMPKKSKKGMALYSKLSGFVDYINKAEKYRLRFAHNPDNNIERFGDLLPYAIVMRIENTWSKAYMPDWDAHKRVVGRTRLWLLRKYIKIKRGITRSVRGVVDIFRS